MQKCREYIGAMNVSNRSDKKEKTPAARSDRGLLNLIEPGFGYQAQTLTVRKR
jgi:hypothetical protein